MIHLFQRIIHNDCNYQRPSPGRLGPNGEGDYVKSNGFGHEDWNFNKKYTVDGLMYGYCFYVPNPTKMNEQFNFAFAKYFQKKWYLVGFYLKSVFVKQAPIALSVLKHKMKDMLKIKGCLGGRWRKYSELEFLCELEKDAKLSKWRVIADNAIQIPEPVEIPKNLFESKNYRLVRPTEIDQKTFKLLLELGHAESKLKLDNLI